MVLFTYNCRTADSFKEKSRYAQKSFFPLLPPPPAPADLNDIQRFEGEKIR